MEQLPASTPDRPEEKALYHGVPYTQSVETESGGLLAGLSPAIILRVLLRKWWLLLLALALGGSISALYLHQTVPVYRAEATVEMSIRRPRILSQPGAILDDGFGGGNERMNTRLRKLEGPETREEARKLLRAKVTEPEQERINAAVSTVKMSRQVSSYLVTVTALDTDPAFAALVANTYVEAVLIRSLLENRAESDSAVAWLQQQAVQQADILEQAEKELLAFRSAQGMDLLELDKNILEASVSSLSAELTGIDKQKVMANEVLAVLDKIEARPEEVGNFPDTIPYHDKLLSELTGWSEAVAKLNLMKAHLTENHPDYIEQQRQVAAARNRFAEVIQLARDTAKANLQLHDQQVQSLRSRIGVQSDEAAQVGGRIAQLRTRLNAMERTRDSADSSYKGLLKRIEEARMASDENTSMFQLIEAAKAPGRPVFPDRRRILLMGFLGGGVLGILVVMGLHLMENGIEGTDLIERQVGRRVIALIPHEDTPDRANLAKVSLEEGYHPIVEAFANLRAMLESVTYRNVSSTLLITSTAPQEGKTTVASNLAISWARAGHRTLLVGFDLRRPQLRAVFNIPDAHPSLANVLKAGARADFESASFKVESIPLWVSSSIHGHEISASEILGGAAVAAFIDWAEKEYDRVIIDSPPYSLIGDALVLAGRVKGVLLVCRPKVTRMRALRHVSRDFSDAGANVLGVLVNDVKFNKTSYFSNYHYYDHHAYRYSSTDYSTTGQNPPEPAPPVS